MYKYRHKLKFLLIALVLQPHNTLAQILNPAKTISEVTKNANTEWVMQLAQARVVLVDYALLKIDFPELRVLSQPEIDQWLLERAAYVSIPQTKSNKTNTAIITTAKKIQAYRPPDYNRALVFKAGSGLIDSKGNGSLRPSQGGHSNGLASLGEMIREFAYQLMVQKVFDHAHSGLKTVGNYAVIDYGFRVIHADGSSSPAGAILRQAHARAKGYMSMLPTQKAVAIERLIREYGITSTGTKRDTSYDILNTQGTTNGAVIDFGGFLVVKDYQRRAVKDLESDRFFFQPDSADIVKPNQDFRVPYELWGSSVMNVDDSKTDNPFIWSHELAEALTDGRAARRDAEQHLKNLLEPLDLIFKKHPRKLLCKNLF